MGRPSAASPREDVHHKGIPEPPSPPDGPVLLRLEGLFCTSCARAAEAVLGRVAGVAGVRVGFATRVARLSLAPGADREAVAAAATAAATRLGYPARPWRLALAGLPGTADDTDGDELAGLGGRLAVGWLLGMWVMLAQLGIYLSPGLAPETAGLLARVAGVLATPVVFVVGARFHLAGWRTLRAGAPGMDLLVSLGATGAWLLSVLQLAQGSAAVWFDTATVLVVLLLTGRLLEARARVRGVDAVRALLELSPAAVPVLRDGGWTEESAALVARGDRIQVAPFARMALDGRVAAGRSSIDTAALTGESLPVAVGPGDTVQAGCRNGAGVLEVEVTAPVGQRALDTIATQVRTALDQRAEVQGPAEWWSERLVWGVLGLAPLAVLGNLALGVAPLDAVLRGLTVLVVTCPCALGVAAPLVRVVAIGRAARRGVLIRDPDALERAGLPARRGAAGPRVVAFDKTGTLTEGRPVVVGVELVAPGVDRAALLWAAASAEVGSAHPIAQALREASLGDAGGEREAHPGQGVSWRSGGRTVRVGSRRWLGPVPLAPSGDTEVWVEDDGVLLGRVRLADALRPDAAGAVRALVDAGYGVRMWSGDSPAVVAAVAAAVGIPPAHAAGGLSPLDKAALVAELENAGQPVIFVGDGVNDAPGLARATVGVAVDAAADAARAAAGIVLRAGSLADGVVGTLALARSARRRAALNVGWAVVYNVVALPLAAVGAFPPAAAALAMVLSSLAVTLNAVRR